MNHHMHLNELPFRQIERGEKTIEARIFDEKRQTMHAGDTFVFENRSDSTQTISATILHMHTFPTFLEMFTTLPVEKFGWENGTTPEEAARDMKKYYSDEEEKQYGVVGIEITLLDSKRRIPK